MILDVVFHYIVKLYHILDNEMTQWHIKQDHKFIIMSAFCIFAFLSTLIFLKGWTWILGLTGQSSEHNGEDDDEMRQNGADNKKSNKQPRSIEQRRLKRRFPVSNFKTRKFDNKPKHDA